jgi:CTD small phosphatase-like protein 2
MKHPYITTRPKKQFTLVLDLDETLIHYDEEIHRCSDGIKFNTRPFAHEFLREMSKYFEIVIYTAADQTYADEVLDRLDADRVITHRLYRQHVLHIQNNNTHQLHLIKDLRRIGRDLEKTIIIDNLKENFQWQKENGIEIKTWYKDPTDTELFKLIPPLRAIG